MVPRHGSATTGGLLLDFDFGPHSESDGAKSDAQFRGAEAENAVWFEALAKEQLALMADGISHGSSFCLVVTVEILWASVEAAVAALSAPAVDQDGDEHMKHDVNECKVVVVRGALLG